VAERHVITHLTTVPVIAIPPQAELREVYDLNPLSFRKALGNRLFGRLIAIFLILHLFFSGSFSGQLGVQSKRGRRSRGKHRPSS
jgi:hypothetical protein